MINVVLLLLTRSRLSQASLLGANKVKEPLPSIFSLMPDLSVYSWVVRALTSSRVPYTWSMGATVGSREKRRMLCVHCQGNQTVLITCQVNIYLQDILACRLASCTQDSTHRELHFTPHKKRNENTLLDVLSEKNCYHFYLVIYLMQTMQSNIATGLQWMYGCRMDTCGQLSFPGPSVAVNKNLKK